MIRTFLFSALIATAATAQSPVHVHDVPGFPCVLSEGPGPAASSEAVLQATAMATASARSAAPTETVRIAGAASTFIVNYTGFTPEAQAAFQVAVDVWADHVSSTVPIKVDATFAELPCSNDGCTLGAAGPLQVFSNVQGGRLRTAYPSALANAIAGEDLSSRYSDIRATFNSNYPAPGTNFRPFYFGTDGNPPPDQIDFTTVVLHELGHGLGFFGSGRFEEQTSGTECEGVQGQGCYGYDFNTGLGDTITLPVIFDVFLEDRSGTVLTNQQVYPNPSIVLGNLLRSEDLFVDAPTVREVALRTPNVDERPEAWAPATFEAGSSYSHWDENQFLARDPNALMTPRIGGGEAYRDPGPLTCAFFGDMGWPLGTGCLTLTTDDEDALAAEALALAGPNPFRQSTAVRVTTTEPGPLDVAVLDALGRRVAVLHAGPVASGTRTFTVDGAGLAPGVYVVRVGAVSVRLVRAR